MLKDGKIWLGNGETPSYLLLNQANRHGLIAGASGTGKTVTMKVLAEGFSKAGVPVFLADAKGDVRGMCQPGEDSEKMQTRLQNFGVADEWTFEGVPCRFWNVLDGDGIPARITISQMGPALLSRLLNLTDAQEGILNIVFRVADDQQLLLDDMKDLRAMLNYVAEHSKDLEMTYGKIATASVTAIIRNLLSVEDEGGDKFFNMPALDLNDWFACDANGQGYVNILDSAKLITSPQIYSMFLLWMLSQLFETLPEVGDLDKPKFVFFFDEAHLLFKGMPKELLDKIIQVVKLIRSKGVGIYFITQSPSDIPDEVLAQLSNKIQHALRAYTPAELKAVKAAAQSFRENPAFKTEDAILDLATGEALVSCLDEDGRPNIVDRVKIFPSQCLMAAPEESFVNAVLDAQTALMAKYGEIDERDSAFEDLNKLAARKAEEDALAAEREALEKEKAEFEKQKAAEQARAEKEAAKQAEREERAREKKREQREREMAKTMTSFGRTAGNTLIRGVLKTLLH